MCQNVNELERLFRAIIGIALIMVGAIAANKILIIVGGVLCLTAMVGFCPLYIPFKKNQC